MIKEQANVREFHETFNIEVNDSPCIPDEKTKQLRLSLIKEELSELENAFIENDLVEIADAIGDLLYVVYGTAVTCGINMNPVFSEIHRSNMTKVGGYWRADGKYMKPETYSPADLLPILVNQIRYDSKRSVSNETI